MSGARFADITKNIRNHLVSYIAIIIITAIAAMAYLGVNYTSDSMKKAGEKFYDSTHFMDVKMMASLLMSEEDLSEIKAVGGVEDAEAVYSTDAYVGRVKVKAVSLTERISVPEIVEGRLPAAADECAVEIPSSEAERDEFILDNIITLSGKDGGMPEYMSRNGFKIVGIVRHPDHLSVKLPEDPYVIVTADAFDHKALEDHFMGAVICIEGADALNSFDRAYFKRITSTAKALEDLSEARAKLRDDEIHTKCESEIEQKQSKLDETRTKLDDDRAKLDAEQDSLDESRKKLKDTKKALSGEKEKLDKREKELTQTKKDLDELKAAVDKEQQKLDNKKAELTKQYNDIRNRKNEFKNALIPIYKEVLSPDDFGGIKWAADEAERDVNDKEVVAHNLTLTSLYTADTSLSLEDIAEELLTEQGLFTDEISKYMSDILAKESFKNLQGKYRDLSNDSFNWDNSHTGYLDSLAKFTNSTKKNYDDNYKPYEKEKAKFDRDLAAYNEKNAKYNADKSKLDKKQKALDAREAKFADRQQKYNNGMEEVHDMQKKLADMDACKWFQFTRKANPSYIDISMVAGNLAKIGFSFSLIFVIMGVIVCYATVGRMVDEDSRLIGIAKAQGLRNSEIFSKYLIFGITATVVGMVVGVMGAYSLIEGTILESVSNLYVASSFPKSILPVQTALVFVAGIVIAIAAVVVAELKFTGASVSSLMSGNAHRAEAATSDKKRIAVSVVTVMGIAALMVICITLKHSVAAVPERQFGSIVKYDATIDVNPYINGNIEKDIENTVFFEGAQCYGIYRTNLTYKLGDSYEVGELLAADDNEFQNFYSLRDVKGKKLLEIPESGILIQKRVAETYDIYEGDTITIYDENGKGRDAVVEGIFNNYTGRTMVTSRDYYNSLFDENVAHNRYLVKGHIQSAELTENLSKVKGFVAFKPSDTGKWLFESISRALNALIALFVVLAVALGLFVLLDFANLYVWQKRRELTVMRLNGFTVKQARDYIARETYITTAVGIVLGVASGAGLSYWIIRLLEQPHIQLVRDVSIIAWAVAVLFTLLLSIVIYAIAFSGIKNLKVRDLED